MNKAETIKFLGIIHAFFPNKDESKEQIQAKVNGWHIMLEDMPYDLAEQALKAVLSKTKFFPTIAEIREEASRIARPMPTAGQAWEETVNRIRKIGHTGKPIFSDPLIGRAAHAMGWMDMCTSENIDVVRGQFIKLYNDMAKEEREKTQVPLSVHRKIAATKRELEKPNLKLLPDPKQEIKKEKRYSWEDTLIPDGLS